MSFLSSNLKHNFKRVLLTNLLKTVVALFALEKKVVKIAWLATWFMTLHDSNIGLCLYLKKPNNKDKRWRLTQVSEIVEKLETSFFGDENGLELIEISPTNNKKVNKLTVYMTNSSWVIFILFHRMLFMYFVFVSYVHSEDITWTISFMSNIKIWKKTMN